MTTENFCYWLHGYFEILQAGPKATEKQSFTPEQVEMIDKHLKSVFAEPSKPQTSISTPFHGYYGGDVTLATQAYPGSLGSGGVSGVIC